MQLDAAGSSQAPEITPLFSLSGRFTRGRTSKDVSNACLWLLIWPELGAEVEVSGGERNPYCQIILLKLSPGFWVKKQKPEMFEPDNPGNHPAQALLKCFPHIINPCRCFLKMKGKKKKKSSMVKGVLEKIKLYPFSSWGFSTHINMVNISKKCCSEEICLTLF